MHFKKLNPWLLRRRRYTLSGVVSFVLPSLYAVLRPFCARLTDSTPVRLPAAATARAEEDGQWTHREREREPALAELSGSGSPAGPGTNRLGRKSERRSDPDFGSNRVTQPSSDPPTNQKQQHSIAQINRSLGYVTRFDPKLGSDPIFDPNFG